MNEHHCITPGTKYRMSTSVSNEYIEAAINLITLVYYVPES